MAFDPKFWQELKEKNDIVEVIGSYVPLTRKGGQYWACCPFHHEKTPSFAIKQEDGFYHCFGCGVSGDVVKFVQQIESTDFMGAVRILAARAKIPVPESNFDSEKAALLKKKRDALVEILLASARFYLSNLYGGKADAHLEYISRRKLAPTTVKKFGLGASLRSCFGDDEAQGSIRLRRLLACQTTEEACRILRPMLSLITAKAAKPLCFATLLEELLYFESNGQERIKMRWARDFYSLPNEPKAAEGDAS